jgi:LysM repeat protein
MVAAVLALIVGLFSMDYTVERGDSLSRIASEQGVSLRELIDANDISNPNLIYPGQVLVIPGQGGKPDVIHVVTRGETLTRIASTYGTTGRLLAEANGLTNPDLIRIGQEITIPGASSSTPVQGSNDGETNGGGGVGPTARSGKSHIVKSGESIESIASKYSGVSAASLRTANGIVGNTIYTGTRLFLDGSGFVATGSSTTGNYTVKSGDRLGDIARAHATSVSSLVDLNGLSNPDLIRPGQILKVPGGSSWMCPVGKASFFNDWGFPRSGGRYHEGNDLFTSRGTPVVAPVAGKVTFIVGPVGGNQFTLDGKDGVRYLGSHMDSFNGSNRNVAAGDVLGYVGTTGNAVGSSPHLHFAIYIKGDAVNPYPSLIQHGCRR